LRLSWYDNFG